MVRGLEPLRHFFGVGRNRRPEHAGFIHVPIQISDVDESHYRLNGPVRLEVHGHADRKSGDQNDEHYEGGGGRPSVLSEELLRSVHEAWRTGCHRLVLEMSVEVLSEDGRASMGAREVLVGKDLADVTANAAEVGRIVRESGGGELIEAARGKDGNPPS